MPGKNYLKRLVPEVALALGIALIIIGIFLLFQSGERLEGVKVARINQSPEEFSLEYFHLYPQLEDVKIVIPNGSSGLTVANILEERGLIKAEDFRKLISLFQFQGRIKAGEFSFRSDASIADILSKIVLRR
ncbi:MAG: hypothetical protein PWR10_600 [Halanaerobiales bacterium]|nr:hypothetical protein [Halanaerobiales bacterium]